MDRIPDINHPCIPRINLLLALCYYHSWYMLILLVFDQNVRISAAQKLDVLGQSTDLWPTQGWGWCESVWAAAEPSSTGHAPQGLAWGSVLSCVECQPSWYPACDYNLHFLHRLWDLLSSDILISHLGGGWSRLCSLLYRQSISIFWIGVLSY